MKRTLFLALIALVVVSCGATSDGAEAPPSTAPALVEARFSTPLPAGATAGARIAARGALRVGVRYDLEPFGFVTDEGEVAGLDVDLARDIASRWLGDPNAVRFSQVRSDNAVARLQAGDVDLAIAALTHSLDREAGADFSLPYFIDGQALLVRTVDEAQIVSPANLDGRRLGAVAWSNAVEDLQAAGSVAPTVVIYERLDEAVAALGRGEVDAVADLRRRLARGQRMRPDTAIVGQYSQVPVAIAYPEDDPFIANLVHLTVQDLAADGTLDRIRRRWLASDGPAIERWPGFAATPNLASPPTSHAAPNTIASIEARGRLVVAVIADRYPFAYVDSQGALAGYEVDLVRACARIWLDDATAVEFIPVSEGAGKEMVFTGQVDMLVGGLVHSRQAELELDFSQTTYLAGVGLLVHDADPVGGLEDLQARTVAAVEGSGSQAAMISAAQAAGVSVAVSPAPALDAAVAQLMAGQVSGVVADRASLLSPAYGTPELSVLPLRLTQSPIALGVPPGDSDFRDLVNLTLQTMRSDGEFAGIYGLWFTDAPPMHVDWPGLPYRPLQLAVASSQGG